jgi:MraZ protein
MFRGNYVAKIDDKGRLKIPTAFRRILLEKYSSEVYITSFTGDNVHIYPLNVWEEIESRLINLPTTNPVKMKFLNRCNYYGQEASVDKQGRVLIKSLLRETASMDGEVSIIGHLTYLEVWNVKKFEQKIKSEPITDSDMSTLSELGI